MHHHLTRLAMFSALLVTAPLAIGDTVIIHAGQLLAIPGQAVKSSQAIVVENERIVEVKNGFSDPAEFEGEVSVIDLKDQFVLPGLMDVHVHLQGELGPKNDRESLKLSLQQIEMHSVMS